MTDECHGKQSQGNSVVLTTGTGGHLPSPDLLQSLCLVLEYKTNKWINMWPVRCSTVEELLDTEKYGKDFSILTLYILY